jgi:hypothetical protein
MYHFWKVPNAVAPMGQGVDAIIRALIGDARVCTAWPPRAAVISL